MKCIFPHIIIYNKFLCKVHTLTILTLFFLEILILYAQESCATFWWKITFRNYNRVINLRLILPSPWCIILVASKSVGNLKRASILMILRKSMRGNLFRSLFVIVSTVGMQKFAVSHTQSGNFITNPPPRLDCSLCSIEMFPTLVARCRPQTTCKLTV